MEEQREMQEKIRDLEKKETSPTPANLWPYSFNSHINRAISIS
jgi:hypothetical protein